MESTLGQAMLSLKYRNERFPAATSPDWISRRQKILYACLLIGCPWLRDRSHDLVRLLRLDKWRDNVQQVIKWVETGFKLATLANFLVFLRQGSYMSVLERLLGIRSVFPQQQGMRQVTFEYMTRELLWHGFSEFLFFILPLVNFQKVKNFVLQKILPSASKSALSHNAPRDFTSCAVCGDWPIRAQEIGCHHVFCYFCIHSNYKADPGFACPLCSQKIGKERDIRSVTIVPRSNNDDDDNT
ncbi:hypothetical protein DPMN_119766 [Dreissena polymorpha]|uniref:RING-type E3 ubiquitin transferase (cysteine targeting) n=2 Tax=Dreissena polymorpha TaxID=45954 RepID=A0A9D4GJC6_DREPO|nr:hypothetical protein DPMN_119766 [Dreissena polymorpha]